MASVSSIAISGMNAALASLNVAATNIANASTPGVSREQVRQSVQPGGGAMTSTVKLTLEPPTLEADIVAQLQAKNAFLANLAVFRTGNRLAGALLDQTA